jgi:hypothetical protein
MNIAERSLACDIGGTRIIAGYAHGCIDLLLHMVTAR